MPHPDSAELSVYSTAAASMVAIRSNAVTSGCRNMVTSDAEFAPARQAQARVIIFRSRTSALHVGETASERRCRNSENFRKTPTIKKRRSRRSERALNSAPLPWSCWRQTWHLLRYARSRASKPCCCASDSHGSYANEANSMRIGIVGAGPAGMLFALLAKRRQPDLDIRVVEQNAPDATFGFGVVFSHGALEFLARDTPDMHASLSGVMETWPIQRIVHRDTPVDIDGNGFCAIARIALLQILSAECSKAGMRIAFGTALDSLAPFADCDLVVGADGVNSIARREHAAVFEPTIDWLTNKFAWYGTTKVFACLTLTFRQNEHGTFVAHHYRYAPDRSTFIVECDAATWQRAGFGAMDDAASRAYCERLFAPDLEGHPLVSNRSIWRNFPLLSNKRWAAGNVVLIGDALRTGHFSIGSGTRLAFDDAIALDRALGVAGDDVPRMLTTFERERRPVVDKLVAAATSSSFWYERMADKMTLIPLELAHDYMTRSGRMNDER